LALSGHFRAPIGDGDKPTRPNSLRDAWLKFNARRQIMDCRLLKMIDIEIDTSSGPLRTW